MTHRTRITRIEPASPPTLALDSLAVGYTGRRRRRTVVIPDVTAELRSGELVCVLGPNGAGKSTLLRTLVGAQPEIGGAVRLGGDNLSRLSVRERAQRLSAVFTDRVDVGFMNARALVGLGRSPRLGWFSAMGVDDHDVVEQALAAAGATELAERAVAELSDGETQRVMIARALAQQPSLLVLDEPTAYLDLTRRVELTALLRRLVATAGLAVLMSTHDLELALRVADQIWLVHPDGRFETGAPEDLALGGSIRAAYASDDVEFDHDAGTFVIADGTVGRGIAVVGPEPAVTWARRATTRAGWNPLPPGAGADLAVEVGPADDGMRWRLVDRERRELAAGERLGDLVARLRDERIADEPVDPPPLPRPASPTPAPTTPERTTVI